MDYKFSEGGVVQGRYIKLLEAFPLDVGRHGWAGLGRKKPNRRTPALYVLL